MQQTTPNLKFPNLLNVRDLGDYQTRSGLPLRRRSLLRTDDLNRLTPAGVQALLDYGVRTVIDLRWPVDADVAPNHFHNQPGLVNHHHISLLGESIEAWRATRPEQPKEMFNCLVLDYFSQDVCRVLQAIAAAPPGAVLFHCVSGKDRTGFVATLLLALVDVEPALIAHDYGLSTENLREPYLAAYPDQPEATLERVRCPPKQVFNMLEHLERRYQGVEDYLHWIGLSAREVELLRARLLATEGMEYGHVHQ